MKLENQKCWAKISSENKENVNPQKPIQQKQDTIELNS